MTDYALRHDNTGEITPIKLECDPWDASPPEGHTLMEREGEGWAVVAVPSPYEMIAEGSSYIEAGLDKIEQGLKRLNR